MELSLLRTFAPGSESTMVWNFLSLELSFPGTFAQEQGARSESSKNFRSLELSLPGTFAPGSESSKNFRSLEPSLPGTFAPGSKIPRAFAPTPSDFRSRHLFLDIYVCIRGCVRVLRPIHIRRRPHNHHFQHTTLVSLTTKLS